MTSLNQLKPASMLQNIPNQHAVFFSTGRIPLRIFAFAIPKNSWNNFQNDFFFQAINAKDIDSQPDFKELEHLKRQATKLHSVLLTA